MQDSARLSSERSEGPPEGARRRAVHIGRYAIERVLGSGSMGVVYRAFDSVLQRTVAIKTLRDELLSAKSHYRAYRKRFFREASIFGSLSHPGIVPLYDVGETDHGVPFFAMEYVSGGSLARLLRGKTRLCLDRAMWMLAQLASATDYAHERGVIHRDIKPANILVRDRDETKMADFGIAKVLGSEFTRSQTLLGTPGYMSPEQVLGQPLTERSDVFSLGVVAFELFSGRKPFPGASVHAILHALVHAEPILPPGLERLGLVTEKWTDVFGRALAKTPAERYPTASAFVSELVELFPGSWLGELVSNGRNEAGAEELRAPRKTVAPSTETLTLWRRRPG